MRGSPRQSSCPARHIVLVCIATIATSGAHASTTYEGTAQAVNGGKLLYRELHTSAEKGDNSSGTVTYVCPDGKPFARKILTDNASPSAPDFELTDGRTGYVEGARMKDGKHVVYVRAGKGEKEKTAVLNSSDDLVIDGGFDAFVRTHWADLVAAKKTTISFVVPSRLEALDFDVEHIGKQTIDGKPTEHFRLELARWYGGLLPHIDVFYDAASKQLLRYVGLSNVRNAANKNVVVRIDFPVAKGTGMVEPVDPSTPLDGTCDL